MRGADHGSDPAPGGEGGREEAGGRQDSGPLPGMARWRWYLYRLLARFEASEAEYYDLPAERHVQVEPSRHP